MMNNKLFRNLFVIGVCLLIAEVTLLTSPQRGTVDFGGARGATAQPQQASLPTGPASISGVVLKTHNRTPIEGVEIQATFLAGGTATVMTDASGSFTFKDIAPGNYRIRAQRRGFFGSAANGSVAPMQNTQVVVSPAQPNVTTEILLLEGATVSGRVTDVNRRPVPEARVAVISFRYAGGEATLATSGNGVTDVDGNYQILGVEPGEYYLRAAVIRNVAGESTPQTVTYFPSGTDYSQGVVVAVAAGSQLTADIQLVEGTRRRVAGRLVGADPAAIGPVSFMFMPQGAAATDNLEGRATQRGTTADGSFQVETMRPGIYDLFAFTTTASLSGRARVDLRDKDAGDITIALAPTVEFEVRFVGERAASYTQGGFALAPVEMPLPPGFRPRPVAGFGARGQTTQTFTNVPQGKYSVVANNLRNDATYVADIVQNGKSILDDGVITIGTEEPAPVDVRVAAGGGVIQGTVQLLAGTPAAITVVAIPEGPRQQNSLLYSRMQLAAGRLRGQLPGTFRIQGVTPGRYKVFAFGNSLTPFTEQNREFMKPYEKYGVPVDVSLGGAAPNITVPLIPSK